MLHIFHRSKQGSQVEHQITWHVGQPATYHEIAYVDNVYAVQADGDELQYILGNMGGLPFLRSNDGFQDTGMTVRKLPKVWRWYGDHAKFIAGNL